MPQFELESVGPGRFSGRARGRTPEEAVRRAAELPAEVIVTVEEDENVHGWRTVRLDGEASGRVRLHQRMQFRRD